MSSLAIEEEVTEENVITIEDSKSAPIVESSPPHKVREATPAAEVASESAGTNYSEEVAVCSSSPTAQMSVAALMGLVFGICFQKSGVYLPANIRAQFTFDNWILLKTFLAAVGTGALVLCAIHAAYPELHRSVREEFKGCCKRGIVTGAGLGGCLLGTGMAVAGACPGMVLSQVGSGVAGSGFTMLGGVSGALAFGLLEPMLRGFLARTTIERFGAEELFSTASYSQLAAALGIGCVGVVLVLERLVDWRTEADASYATCTTAMDCPWPPGVAGAIIGLLQAPCALFLGDTLGSSSAYMTAVSWLFTSDAAEKRFPYFAPYARLIVPNLWQFGYVLVVILGSYLASSTAGTYGQAAGVSTASSLVGGFLMVFGSRLGGGCTSGHGLSGMALLSLLSFAAVPAMFGGGIAAGFIMQAAGGR